MKMKDVKNFVKSVFHNQSTPTVTQDVRILQTLQHPTGPNVPAKSGLQESAQDLLAHTEESAQDLVANEKSRMRLQRSRSATFGFEESRSRLFSAVDPPPLEIEEHNAEIEEHTAEIEEHTAKILLSTKGSEDPQPPRPSLFGAVAQSVTNQLQQFRQFRLFSSKGRKTKRSKGPRIFKLCLFPRPGEISRGSNLMTIHNLCIQDEKDHRFVDYPGLSEEEYTLDAEQEMDEVLLERLKRDWKNYEESESGGKTNTDFEFRQLMWNRHGKHSGLALEEYFALTVSLFDTVNKVIEYLALSKGSEIHAMQLALRYRRGLEVEFGCPLSVYPEIVCHEPDADNKALLKELRCLFIKNENDDSYMPYDSKRLLVKCEHNTLITF